MNTEFSRREMLRFLGGIVALVATPVLSFAKRPAEAFEGEASDAAVKGLFGDLPVESSDAIDLKVPDIAENGAVVPVSVKTSIEGAETIAIVIDNNPTPLSSVFDVSGGVVPDVSTRIKMGESSMIRAYVKAADKVYTVGKEVKVTIGGCGG